ncbi:MAG: hypothetical protein JWL84_16 [Rhodospirillales bacterium]|nr:hypothetical protein [Rhodospirillales bacterium]
MPEQSSLPRVNVRNPLSIIALFISFIYALSTAVLALKAEALGGANQTVMILFITLFPVLVFLTFTWLVAQHHEKLYSPQDYRTDEGFHYLRGAPSRLGGRLEEELAEAQGDDADQASNDSEAVPTQRPQAPHIIAPEVPQELRELPRPSGRRSVLEAFVAEGLAFQELQEEFKAPFTRHVRIGSAEVDGILETTSGRIVVEVKVVGPYSKNIVDVVYSLSRVFNRIKSTVLPADTRYIGVIIATDASVADRLSHSLTTVRPEHFEARVFLLDELKKKYGMTEPNGSPLQVSNISFA